MFVFRLNRCSVYTGKISYIIIMYDFHRIELSSEFNLYRFNCTTKLWRSVNSKHQNFSSAYLTIQHQLLKLLTIIIYMPRLLDLMKLTNRRGQHQLPHMLGQGQNISDNISLTLSCHFGCSRRNVLNTEMFLHCMGLTWLTKYKNKTKY